MSLLTVFTRDAVAGASVAEQFSYLEDFFIGTHCIDQCPGVDELTPARDCGPRRPRSRQRRDVTCRGRQRTRRMDGSIEWGVPLATACGMQRTADSLGLLMERYTSGDMAAFEPLYRHLSAPLYRFCLRLTMRRAEADDLFQETFLKLHRARATYLPGSNALYWTYAIARSLYVSRLRYWNRRPEHLGAQDDVAEHVDIHPREIDTPEGEVLAEHLAGVVSRELAKMSEKNRSAYVLMKEEGLSAKDTAALLGTSPTVVKQRAHRAYEQLREALGAAGWFEGST